MVKPMRNIMRNKRAHATAYVPVLFFILAATLTAILGARAQAMDAVADASSGLEPFYDGRFLHIDNFDDISIVPCSDDVSVGAGGLCYLFWDQSERQTASASNSPNAADEHDDKNIPDISMPRQEPTATTVRGAVLVTANDGYDLTTRQALERHLDQSRGALAGIENIEVVASEIVENASTTDLIARLELLRNDGGIARRFSLLPPVRQISYLYPHGSQLVQVFVYASADSASDDVVNRIERTLKSARFKSPQNDCSLGDENCDDSTRPNAVDDKTTDGALALMPRALFYGGAIALAIILILHLRTRIRRRQTDHVNH